MAPLNEYVITANIRVEIPVSAWNITHGISQAKERTEDTLKEFGCTVRDFDAIYIKQGDSVFTYDYGCHGWREKI